jgi:hypothetical protein
MIQWIVIGGLGFTASEQFSKTKNDKDNNTKQDTNDEEPIDYYSDKIKAIWAFKLFLGGLHHNLLCFHSYIFS